MREHRQIGLEQHDGQDVGRDPRRLVGKGPATRTTVLFEKEQTSISVGDGGWVPGDDSSSTESDMKQGEEQ